MMSKNLYIMVNLHYMMSKHFYIMVDVHYMLIQPHYIMYVSNYIMGYYICIKLITSITSLYALIYMFTALKGSQFYFYIHYMRKLH